MAETFITKEQFNTLYGANKEFVYFMEFIENDFRYVYINRSAECVFDTNPEGKFLSEMVQNSDVQNKVKEYYLTAIATRQQTTFRDFYLFSEKKSANETVCTPIFQENHIYILAVTSNIHDQKKLEEKYLWLESLFEDKINPTVILLKDFTVFDVNLVYKKVFGCPLTEQQEFLKSDFINPDDEKKYFQCIKDTFNGNVSSPAIFSHRKSSGEVGDFLVGFSPINMENQVAAISIQWQELGSKVQLKKDSIQTTLLLDSYREALNAAANICITDKNGVIEFVNTGFEKQTQFHADELIGNTNALLNSRKHSQEFYQNLWNTILSGKLWRGEMCNRTKYGRMYWTDTTIVPIKNINGDITHFLGISFDISEKKAIMTNLRNVEKLFRLITEHTSDFIVITSEDGIIQYVSSTHEARLGYEKEELLGKFYFDLLTKESSIFLQNELKQIKKIGNSKMELEILAKDGRRHWIEAQISAVKDFDRKDEYQFVSVAREITERREMEKQLRFLAYHDSLTMLPNRRYLLEKFDELADDANSSGRSIAVLLIDGDNFKRINDEYGHNIGDEFIKNFGKALLSSLRDTDIVARIGGDEFVIILTKISLNLSKRNSQIEKTIKRIQKILRKGWRIKGEHFAPTSSIGIACYPEDGLEISLLLDKADTALYYAKKISGKDSYHYADMPTRDGGE